jgi:hypothetical protein
MPKSRRGRGRHLPRGKRRKGRKGFSTPVAQPSAATQAYETAPQAEVAVPGAKAPVPKATVPVAQPAKVPTPKATVIAAQQLNIAAELRRIGILAGIILVIMVVLALIFS